MNPNQVIPGGAAATTPLRSNDGFTKLFKPNVRFLRVRQNFMYILKILPSFDPNIPKDNPARKQSIAPYRSAQGDFNPFFYRIVAHRSVGPQKMDFFSPKTFGPQEIDLIDLLYQTAKASPQFQHLTAKSATTMPQLQSPSELGLFNVFQPQKPEDGVRIAMATKSLLTDLIEKLNLTPDPKMTPVSCPFGDKYQWGDITDLNLGLLAFVSAVPDTSRPNSTFKSFKADFQQFPGQGGVTSRSTYPPASQQMGQALLEGRWDIPDCINIIGTAEMIDYLNGVFPRPLIEQAFGSMYALPAARAGAVPFQAPQGGWPAQAPTAPPQAPQPAAWQQPPQAPAPAPQYQPPAATGAQPWSPQSGQYVAPPPAAAQWPAPAPVAQPPPAAPAAQPWSQPAPQNWQQPPAAPVNQPWPASQPASMPPAGPAGALPQPGSMPPPPPAPDANTIMPGAVEIRQSPDGMWEGFQTQTLAMEYRQIVQEFNSNPQTAQDRSKIQRMTELMGLRKGA